MPWCPPPGASCAQRTGAGGLQVKEGAASAASRPAEGHRDAARPRLRQVSPQHLDIAHSVTDRPFANLSDETLMLLVENARQLDDGSGVVVDEDDQVITE